MGVERRDVVYSFCEDRTIAKGFQNNENMRIIRIFWRWINDFVRMQMSSVSISKASRNLSHWVNKAGYSGEAVVLTSHGRPKAVILGIEAFEALLGVAEYLEEDLLPAEEIQAQFRQALAEHGYRSREEILALVQEVKREMAEEKHGSAES